jgi:hypothetical protein
LRRFTGRVLVAALAVVGGYFAAQMLSQRGPAGAPANGDASAVETAGAAVAGLDGNTLVGRVLDMLERRPNIAADFRQSLQIGDDPLSGVGQYWQQGVGNQRRTCWQWTSLVAGQSASFAQVYDRNGHLWTDKRLSEDERTVTRVDLATVRRELSLAVDGAGQGGAGGDSQQLDLLARGGLSQLIAELRRCFDFGPPAEATVEGRPALAIVGRWRPEALARDWPGLDAKAVGEWPAQLPHHVLLVVGPVDRFPYVVEYRRGEEADLADAPGRAAADPLARYEFFNVRYEATMPERLFEFPSTEVEWHDVTASVVARLRPPAPVQTDATALRPGAWRQ